MPRTTKRCGRCGEIKPLDAFTPRKGVPDGRVGSCRACTNAYVKERNRRLAGAGYRRPPSLAMRYVQIKRQAELRGLPFALTRSEVNAYWDQPCHYCGGAIPGVMLDRVDNTRGYEPGNVVSCCRRCNMWKLTLSEDAFTTHLTRIYQHYVLRQPQPPSVLAYRSARVQPTEAQRDLATSRRECAEALEDAYRFVDDAWGLVVMMGRVHTVVVRALERELAYEQARNRRWRTQADRPR